VHEDLALKLRAVYWNLARRTGWIESLLADFHMVWFASGVIDMRSVRRFCETAKHDSENSRNRYPAESNFCPSFFLPTVVGRRRSMELL
jgi:hypothetical protein